MCEGRGVSVVHAADSSCWLQLAATSLVLFFCFAYFSDIVNEACSNEAYLPSIEMCKDATITKLTLQCFPR